MEHRIVKENYQAWSDGRLGAGERRSVEEHLGACDECRTYYAKMSILIEKTDPALVPRLAPDPFLPSRVRAVVDGRRNQTIQRRARGWLRVSAAGVVFVVAVTAGVYLGRGLTTGRDNAEEARIAEAYYEAFSPSDFSGVWESVLNNADRNGADEGNR